MTDRRIQDIGRGLAGLLVLAAGLAAPAVFANETLVPHTAIYRVKISIASGTLTTAVRRSEDGYQVRSVIEPKGFAGLFFNGTIEENSIFTTDEDGVVPRVYWSTDNLSNDPKRMDFRFDWTDQVVTGTINDDAFEFQLEKEAHDRVSIQYELMHNLVTGADNDEYALLDGDELKAIEVTNIGRRRIDVPYGSFDAIGIRHQAEGSQRITTLWCAKELGYLPVLIEQSRKGKTRVRAELAEYLPEPPAVAGAERNPSSAVR
ncbi:MAG: DUF3108 domain-containing protein [Woeseiaceae bacterium]|nr:DUF3108 domain-containing protein [Woeseiaceae bacterium]